MFPRLTSSALLFDWVAGAPLCQAQATNPGKRFHPRGGVLRPSTTAFGTSQSARPPAALCGVPCCCDCSAHVDENRCSREGLRGGSICHLRTAARALVHWGASRCTLFSDVRRLDGSSRADLHELRVLVGGRQSVASRRSKPKRCGGLGCAARPSCAMSLGRAVLCLLSP